MNPASPLPTAAAALSVLLLAAGCATTDYSYSRLVGTRYYRAPIDTYPLQILRVDRQEAPLNPRDWTLVEPGTRTVVVATYPSPIDRVGNEKSIEMKIEPCTQYHLVAVKANRLSHDYEVRVDHQEPVPGCKPPATAG